MAYSIWYFLHLTCLKALSLISYGASKLGLNTTQQLQEVISAMVQNRMHGEILSENQKETGKKKKKHLHKDLKANSMTMVFQ